LPPVCIIWCLFRFDDDVNPWENVKDLSPVGIFWCDWRLLSCENPLEHTWRVKGFFSYMYMYSLMCFGSDILWTSFRTRLTHIRGFSSMGLLVITKWLSCCKLFWTYFTWIGIVPVCMIWWLYRFDNDLNPWEHTSYIKEHSSMCILGCAWRLLVRKHPLNTLAMCKAFNLYESIGDS